MHLEGVNKTNENHKLSWLVYSCYPTINPPNVYWYQFLSGSLSVYTSTAWEEKEDSYSNIY
jgi:hypothetical protein